MLLGTPNRTPIIFDQGDRKLLIDEIRRRLLTFLYVFVVAAILAFAIVSWIQNAEIEVNKLLIYSIFGLGCLAALFIKLTPAIMELKKGIKYVAAGRITYKKKKPRYAYSQNVVVDSAIKLGTMEYYVVIDDREIWV